jgi:hypothetical protein
MARGLELAVRYAASQTRSLTSGMLRQQDLSRRALLVATPRHPRPVQAATDVRRASELGRRGGEQAMRRRVASGGRAPWRAGAGPVRASSRPASRPGPGGHLHPTGGYPRDRLERTLEQVHESRLDELAPPQLLAASLHDLVDLYVAASLDEGDLGALGPLRLLRDRADGLLQAHARHAHYADGQPWHVVADRLGVSPQAMSARDRRARRARSAPAG